MNKRILCLTLTLLMLISALSSCAPKKGVAVEELVAVSYDDSGLSKKDVYTKTGQEKRSGTVFGHEYTVYYDRTVRPAGSPYAIDIYSYALDDTAVSVSYRDNTFLMTEYNIVNASVHSHETPVSPDSEMPEFITYASVVLESYAGVSTVGWDSEISTYLYAYGNRKEFEKAPAGEAEYTVTFTKKIGDLVRGDKMHVTMTNTGEIISFSAAEQDEAFAPYTELEISKKDIERAVWGAAGELISKYNITSQKITDIRLEVTDDALWAVASLEYSSDITSGSVEYAVKAAELK